MGLKKSLILLGLKHSGKTTLGILAARHWNTAFRDLDDWLLNKAKQEIIPPPESCRDLYRRSPGLFQQYEAAAAAEAAALMEAKPLILSLGGGAVENPPVMGLLEEQARRGLLIRIYLMEEEEVLYGRIAAGGIPPFLEGPDPRQAWHSLYLRRHGLCADRADITLALTGANPVEALEKLKDAVTAF